MRKIKRGSIKPTRTIENKTMTDENTTAVPAAPVDATDATPVATDAPAADLAPLDAPVEAPTPTPEIIATDAAPAPVVPVVADTVVETPAPEVAREEQTITAADVADAGSVLGLTDTPAPIVPAPVETPAPVEVPVVPVVPETPAAPITPVAVETPVADLAPLEVDAVHPVTTHIRNLLDSYHAEMRPGYPTNADQGKFKQRHLESVYKQVLARTEGEFDIAMEALLAYVDEHRNGIFAEGYVFRFMAAAWPSAQNRSFFETFTALILRIHDPKSRGIVLRQSINYINVLKKLLKPEEAERLQGFIEKYL